jgi:serine/threonine protein kinase
LIYKGSKIYDAELNEYIVGDVIGSGAFGHVYKLRSLITDELFAVKTLGSAFDDQKTMLAFQSEIKVAQSIVNENVIKYYYAHDGNVHKELSPYIIMEYADGGTLKKLISNQRSNGVQFSNEEMLMMFNQLIGGMKAVNENLIHRDIKPDNILISNNVLKISDFGLSKIIHDKTRLSTFKGFGHLMYMAPEGWLVEKNTTQMDIYSMGIVFYELATLNYPYRSDAKDVNEWRDIHLYSGVDKPIDINVELSPVLSSVIMKMLEKSTSTRFKNWDEIEYFMDKCDIHTSNDGELISSMLTKIAEAERKKSEKFTQERKRAEVLNQLCNTVKYQFEKDIYSPIKLFIEEFNSVSPHGKIKVTYNDKDNKNLKISISLISNYRIDIIIQSVTDEEHLREETIGSHPDFGRRQIVYKTPLLRNRRVIAWGGVYVNNNKGFNIVLLENENDIYGEWITLVNTYSPLIGRKSRPEPFAFKLNELEDEIKYIDIMNIYNTTVETFEVLKVKNLISESNSW